MCYVDFAENTLFASFGVILLIVSFFQEFQEFLLNMIIVSCQAIDQLVINFKGSYLESTILCFRTVHV